MSKFKLIGLDDLLSHSVNTENTLAVETINRFIEETTMHLLHCVSDDGYEIVDKLEEQREFDGEKWRSIVHFDDWTLALVEDSDIFLSCNFEVYGHYEADGEFDYLEVNFTKLNLNWMNNSFNMIGTDVEVLMTRRIEEWV